MSANAQPIRRRPAPGARAATRRIAPTTAALMALCAVILIGVVTVQIAVIRQNMERSDLETQIGSVRAENNLVHASISRASSSGRIREWATGHGMVYVSSNLVEPLTTRPAHGG